MRALKEAGFWVLTAIVLIILFGSSYGGYLKAFYFVAFLMPVIIGTSYTFSLFLVPYFLLRKKYRLFSLYTFYTIVISLNIEMLVITLAFAVLAEYQYEQLLPAAKNIFVLAIIMYFIALLKAFSSLLKFSLSRQEKISELLKVEKQLKEGFLTVKANRKTIKIPYEEIDYIESLSDYVKIHLDSRPTVISKEKISRLEKTLPGHFLRIHRSFIVNMHRITATSAEVVELNTVSLPVSRTYKKAVQQYLAQSNSAYK